MSFMTLYRTYLKDMVEIHISGKGLLDFELFACYNIKR